LQSIIKAAAELLVLKTVLSAFGDFLPTQQIFIAAYGTNAVSQLNTHFTNNNVFFY